MYSVLYVDDEPSLLEIAKLFLEESQEFVVDTKTSAQAGLDLLQDHSFEAIISDYQMPGMDGIGFLKAVRERFGDIPFILFTGRGREEVVIEAINNGADFYIQKGGDPTAQFAELAHKIRQAVARRRAQEELKAAYAQLTASEEELRIQLDEIGKAQQERAKTEENFRMLVDNAPDMMYIQTNNRFVYLNNAALRLLGASSADQLLGKDTYDRIHPSFHERIRKRVESLTIDLRPVGLLEEVYLKLDGTPVDVEVSAVPFLYRGDHGALVMVRDITARKQAEAELHAAYEQITASEEELRGQYDELVNNEKQIRESEEKFRAIFEETHDALVLFNEDGCIDCNHQALELYGYSSREEILGLNPADVSPLFQPDGQDSPSAAAAHIRAVFEKGAYHFEWLHERKDGSTFLADVLLSAFELKGKPVFLSSVRDITERRRLVDELQLLKISVERSSDEVFWMDFKGNILYVNDAACRITGYSADEFRAMKIFELDPDFSPEVWEMSIADLRERKTQFITTRHRCRNGIIIDVEIVAVYVNKDGREYSFAFVRDITGRKRDEQNRQNTMAFLNALIDQNPNAMWISDEKGFLIRMNAACSRLVHSTEEELAGKYNLFDDNIVEEQGFMPLVKSVFEDGRVVSFPLTYDSSRLDALKVKEPVSLILEVTIFPIKDVVGKFTNAVIIHNDITERKRAEESLAESEERFRSLVETSFDGIAIHREGILVYVNRTAARILGYDEPARILGKPALDIVHPDYHPYIIDRIRQGPETPQKLIREKFLRADGSSVDVDVVTTPCTWQGKPAVYVTFRDISEQKRVEEALRRSEENYRTLVENSQSIIYTIRPDGVMTFVSPSWTSLLGHKPSEVVDHDFRIFVHKDDIPRCDEFLKKTVETGAMQPAVEYRVFHKDGTVHWHRSSIIPVFDENNHLVSFVGNAVDFTDRKEAEKEIQQSRDMFRAFIDHSYDAVLINDLNGRVLDVNATMLEMYRITREEALSLTIDDFTGPDSLLSLEKSREIWNQVLSGKDHFFPWQARRPQDGSLFDVEVYLTRIELKNQPIILANVRDVTERQRTEDALRESGAQYKQIFESIVDIYYETDTNGIVRVISPSVYALMGWRPEELLGKSVLILYVNPSDRQMIIEKLKHDPAVSGFEVILRKRDGTPIPVSVNARIRYSGTGEPDGIVGSIRDITENVKAHKALRDSEEKYRHIIENIQDGYFQTDTVGNLSMISPSAARMFGYSNPAEMTGIPAESLFYRPEQRQEVLRVLQERGKVEDFTGEARRKDGTRFWASLGIQFRDDEVGNIQGTEAIVRDITERKKMEQAIQEANRKLNLLNSVTRHDVVNQLTVLQGYARIAAIRKPEPVIADLLAKIDAAAKTIASQIEFTKTYQELGIHTPAWFRLDETIAKAGRKEVTFSNTCNNTEIFADPMLERVFFNIFENAIRHGERLTRIMVRCERAPDGLVIIVEDDGIGIPPEDKEKIFDKGYGKNTGFGLFLVKEILSITRITIRETGINGKGARFEITVPRGAYRFTGKNFKEQEPEKKPD